MLGSNNRTPINEEPPSSSVPMVEQTSYHERPTIESLPKKRKIQKTIRFADQYDDYYDESDLPQDDVGEYESPSSLEEEEEEEEEATQYESEDEQQLFQKKSREEEEDEEYYNRMNEFFEESSHKKETSLPYAAASSSSGSHHKTSETGLPVLEWRDMKHLSQPDGIHLFIGDQRSGKTHMASCLVRMYKEKGVKGYFVLCPGRREGWEQLDQRFVKDRPGQFLEQVRFLMYNQRQEYLRRGKKPAPLTLLVLDDFLGYVQMNTKGWMPVLKKLAGSCRHPEINIIPFFLCQNLGDVLKPLRAVTKEFFLFEMNDVNNPFLTSVQKLIPERKKLATMIVQNCRQHWCLYFPNHTGKGPYLLKAPSSC